MSILKLGHIDFEIIARMVRVTRLLDKAITEKLSTYEITKAQSDVLFVIHFSDGKPLKSSEIAKELFASKATISVIIKRLTELGYVKTKTDKNDLRAQIVSLTEKSKIIINDILPDLLEVSTCALLDMKEKNKVILLSQLYQIEDRMN